MQQISKFELQNNGLFIARMQIEYFSEESSTWIYAKRSGDIMTGFEKTVDPGAYGVPDGSMVRLTAYVVWGTNNEADQMFTYKKNSGQVAQYRISGTLHHNYLEYRGMLDSVTVNMLEAQASVLEAQGDEIVMCIPGELSAEDLEDLESALVNGSRSYNGSCGPFSYNVTVNLDTSDFTKSSIDARVSIFSHDIVNGTLDINHPKISLNLSVLGVGVTGEFGVDFSKRTVYIKGKLAYIINTKEFNYTLFTF